MNGIQLQYANGSNTLEPVVTKGAMAVGDTLQQNQMLLLSLHKGDLKERPSTGVGLSDMLLDNDPIYWRTEIKEQLEMDGQTVTTVRVTQSGVEIDASY